MPPSEFKENAESLNTAESVQVDVNAPMTTEELEAYTALAEVEIPGTWSRSERNALVAANITAARRLLAEVKRIRHENEHHQRYRYTAEQNAHDTARENRELRAELDKVIRESAADKAKLAAVRKIKAQRRNSAMVTSEQLATMHGWNDAVNAIREALEPCECGMTDPSTWEMHGGATEPGSAYEWNPDCPAHGDAPDAAPEMPRPPAQEPVSGPETAGTGSGRGTGVAEASGTARAGEAWIPSFAGDECPHRPEWTCPEHGECRACECDCNTYVADLEEPDLTLIPGDMVVRDPEVCSGRPTMRGTRILASRIAGELAAGTSWETLREWYPSLPSLPVPSTETCPDYQNEPEGNTDV